MSRKVNNLRKQVAREIARNNKLTSERQRLKEHLLTVTARIEVEMPDGSKLTIPYAVMTDLKIAGDGNTIKARAIQQHEAIKVFWPTRPA